MSCLLPPRMRVCSSLAFLIMILIATPHRVSATESDLQLVAGGFKKYDRQLRRHHDHRHHRDASENLYDSDHRDVEGKSNGFRLKMYWEPSYFWQETHRETFWCLQCRNKVCKSGHNLQIRECGGVNTRFEFVGSGTIQVKLASTSLCLTMVSREELQLQNCDSNYNNQKFDAGLGDFYSNRFELYSVPGDGCIANEHHPKEKEIVYNHNKCVGPRSSQVNTSFWVKY